MYSQELTIGIAHALLGDQQDDRGDDQNGAEDVEDGGAHAAGGGKEGTGLVLDLSGNRKIGFCGAALYLNFIRLFQPIVAGRSLGFYQIVGAVGKAFKGGPAPLSSVVTTVQAAVTPGCSSTHSTFLSVSFHL